MALFGAVTAVSMAVTIAGLAALAAALANVFDLSERDVVLPGQSGQLGWCPHQVQAGYPSVGYCHRDDGDEFTLLVDGESGRPVDDDTVDHVAWLSLGHDTEQEARDPVRADDRPAGGGDQAAAVAYQDYVRVEHANQGRQVA